LTNGYSARERVLSKITSGMKLNQSRDLATIDHYQTHGVYGQAPILPVSLYKKTKAPTRKKSFKRSKPGDPQPERNASDLAEAVKSQVDLKELVEQEVIY
jgi:hypothetical protein